MSHSRLSRQGVSERECCGIRRVNVHKIMAALRNLASTFLFSRFTLLVLWALLNSSIFWSTYYTYKSQTKFYYLFRMLGEGLCLARGSASVLNVSCCLVLLPVCRGLNSQLHQLLSVMPRSFLSQWLAHLKYVHITIAFTITLASVVHTWAHVINAINFSKHYNHQYPDINWAKYEGQSPTLLILTSAVGLTGVAMMILLLFIFLLSLKNVRESCYELFWVTHYLFLPFFVLLIAHPFSGVLKELSNDDHEPGCYHVRKGQNLSIVLSISGSSIRVCSALPTFVSTRPLGWLWTSVPLFIYLLDWSLRSLYRNMQPFTIKAAQQLSVDVCELTLANTVPKPLHIKPGQYILLQCPKVSVLEWHPFTVVSSCKSQNNCCISVVVRMRGDWTRCVCNKIWSTSRLNKNHILPHRIYPIRMLVDGPFSSPLEGVLHCRIAVCIAAGIGITPFIAVMHHILRECGNRSRLYGPQRLHVVWVSRTVHQLSWFNTLFETLYEKLWSLNQPDRLEICLYVTRDFKLERLTNVQQSENGFVLQRIHRGRPPWKQLFNAWSDTYKKRTVSVFVCGPEPLTKEIRQYCSYFNNSGCAFKLVQEDFS